MARGIEHRTGAGVLDAYDLNGHANFGIFSGNELMMGYDQGDMTNGALKLSEMLQALEQGGSSTTFTLRIYADDVKNITNKTPYCASTTFMLNGNQNVRTENGVMILDNTRTGQPAAASQANAAVMTRLDNLEKLNRELNEKLHQEQLKSMEQKFQHQIAGLTAQQQEKPDIWERVGEMFLEKPDRMDKIIGMVENIAGKLFGGGKNFIQQPAPSTVHGTSNTTMNRQETEEEEDLEEDQEQPKVYLTPEGALINPFLTEQQRNMKKSAQYPVIKAALEVLDPEDLDQQQMICIEVLEKRLGAATVTHMLLVVAGLDNEDLNKLLNNLS